MAGNQSRHVGRSQKVWISHVLSWSWPSPGSQWEATEGSHVHRRKMPRSGASRPGTKSWLFLSLGIWWGSGLNVAVIAKTVRLWKCMLSKLGDPKAWGHHGVRKEELPPCELWAGEAASLLFPGRWTEKARSGPVLLFLKYSSEHLDKISTLYRVKATAFTEVSLTSSSTVHDIIFPHQI